MGGGAPHSREGWGTAWSSAPAQGPSSGVEVQGLWPSADDTFLVPSLLVSQLRRPTSCPLLLWPLLNTPELPVAHSSLQPPTHPKVTGRCYPGTTCDQLEKTGNE